MQPKTRIFLMTIVYLAVYSVVTIFVHTKLDIRIDMKITNITNEFYLECSKNCICENTSISDVDCSKFDSKKVKADCTDPTKCINLLSCNNEFFCCSYGCVGGQENCTVCKTFVTDQRCYISCVTKNTRTMYFKGRDLFKEYSSEAVTNNYNLHDEITMLYDPSENSYSVPERIVPIIGLYGIVVIVLMLFTTITFILCASAVVCGKDENMKLKPYLFGFGLFTIHFLEAGIWSFWSDSIKIVHLVIGSILLVCVIVSFFVELYYIFQTDINKAVDILNKKLEERRSSESKL